MLFTVKYKEGITHKNLQLGAIGLPVLATLLRTRNQRPFPVVKNDSHIIRVLTCPIETPNELNESPFPPPVEELARRNRHPIDLQFWTAFLSYVRKYFSQSFSQLWPFPDASVKCSGRWILHPWWPWVLAFVSWYISVITHMPNLKRKLHVYWKKGSCHFLWGKIQLRNLLATTSAFSSQNKRESWRAKGRGSGQRSRFSRTKHMNLTKKLEEIAK